MLLAFLKCNKEFPYSRICQSHKISSSVCRVLFRTWAIMGLLNFLSFVALSKICFFAIPLITVLPNISSRMSIHVIGVRILLCAVSSSGHEQLWVSTTSINVKHHDWEGRNKSGIVRHLWFFCNALHAFTFESAVITELASLFNQF